MLRVWILLILLQSTLQIRYVSLPLTHTEQGFFLNLQSKSGYQMKPLITLSSDPDSLPLFGVHATSQLEGVGVDSSNPHFFSGMFSHNYPIKLRIPLVDQPGSLSVLGETMSSLRTSKEKQKDLSFAIYSSWHLNELHFGGYDAGYFAQAPFRTKLLSKQQVVVSNVFAGVKFSSQIVQARKMPFKISLTSPFITLLRSAQIHFINLFNKSKLNCQFKYDDIQSTQIKNTLQKEDLKINSEDQNQTLDTFPNYFDDQQTNQTKMKMLKCKKSPLLKDFNVLLLFQEFSQMILKMEALKWRQDQQQIVLAVRLGSQAVLGNCFLKDHYIVWHQHNLFFGPKRFVLPRIPLSFYNFLINICAIAFLLVVAAQNLTVLNIRDSYFRLMHPFEWENDIYYAESKPLLQGVDDGKLDQELTPFSQLINLDRDTTKQNPGSLQQKPNY